MLSWSILQYFWPVLSDDWSRKTILVFFLRGHLRQVLLYFGEHELETVSILEFDNQGEGVGDCNMRRQHFTWISIWAPTWDFQQCGILTWIDSDEPVQPPIKLRNSKCCSVSTLTVIEYSSNQQRLWSDCAYEQAEPLQDAHTTLLEISCHGSYVYKITPPLSTHLVQLIGEDKFWA